MPWQQFGSCTWQDVECSWGLLQKQKLLLLLLVSPPLLLPLPLQQLPPLLLPPLL